MALITIITSLEKKDVLMVQDIIKYLSIFIIFHLFFNMTSAKSVNIMSNNLFNKNFVMFLLLVVLSFMAYYLIVLELVEIE